MKQHTNLYSRIKQEIKYAAAGALLAAGCGLLYSRANHSQNLPPAPQAIAKAEPQAPAGAKNLETLVLSKDVLRIEAEKAFEKYKQGDKASAEDDLKRLIESAPNYRSLSLENQKILDDVYIKLSGIQREKYNPSEPEAAERAALAYLRELEEKGSTSRDMLENIAGISNFLRDYPTAIKYYRAAANACDKDIKKAAMEPTHKLKGELLKWKFRLEQEAKLLEEKEAKKKNEEAEKKRLEDEKKYRYD